MTLRIMALGCLAGAALIILSMCANFEARAQSGFTDPPLLENVATPLRAIVCMDGLNPGDGLGLVRQVADVFPEITEDDYITPFEIPEQCYLWSIGTPATFLWKQGIIRIEYPSGRSHWGHVYAAITPLSVGLFYVLFVVPERVLQEEGSIGEEA